LVSLCLFAGLTTVIAVKAGAADPPTVDCKAGTYKTVEVGIVKAAACWTEEEKDGAVIHTASFNDHPRGEIDMNGFLLTNAYRLNAGIRINEKTHQVQSVVLDGPPGISDVQINSFNVPYEGERTRIGYPIKIDFVAPTTGEIVLDNLRFLSGNGWVKALGGLAWVGNVETPIKLLDEGKGSMTLTVELTGQLALQGRPQAVAINLPTAVGEGTKIDGFELNINEITIGRFFTVNGLMVAYSAADNEFSGNAEVTLPYKRGPHGDAGFVGGFSLRDGKLSRIRVGFSGMNIPLGAAATLKSAYGDFRWNPEVLVSLNASGGIGPSIPLPTGLKQVAGYNATLSLGFNSGWPYLQIAGGVNFADIPLGEGWVGIYSDAGVNIAGNVGIGLPSVRNNDNDPFYLGGRIEGWIGPNGFQLEGRTRFTLFGWRASEAQVLVNKRALGACVKLLFFDVGGVYEWGKSVESFGGSCGLGRYRESFAHGATISAGGSRTVQMRKDEVMLEVKGDGEAPRFSLRSPSGREISAPETGTHAVREDNAFLIDEEGNTTYVVPPKGMKRWTLTPGSGSATVTSVRAIPKLPSERVRARVVGRGKDRTLIWRSAGGPDTHLSFTEEMPGGRDRGILTTDKANGRHRFKVTEGGHYGKRKLKVTVIHGGAPRETKVADRFRVSPPARKHGPRKVRAWRDGRTLTVRWSRVKGASGYLVMAGTRHRGKVTANFIRSVEADRARVRIPSFPGGASAVARVFTLNRDGRTGRAGKATFRPSPRKMSLKQAGKAGVDTARRSGQGVAIRTSCPAGGHCQTVVTLKHNGRKVGSTRFQQTPGTFHRVTVLPASKRLRRQIARGPVKGLSIVLWQKRTSGKGGDKGRVRPGRSRRPSGPEPPAPARVPSTVPPR